MLAEGPKVLHIITVGSSTAMLEQLDLSVVEVITSDDEGVVAITVQSVL